MGVHDTRLLRKSEAYAASADYVPWRSDSDSSSSDEEDEAAMGVPPTAARVPRAVGRDGDRAVGVEAS